MQEVIERRFRNYFEKTDEGFSIMPDLILLDGGNGHVNAVEPVLERMGVTCPFVRTCERLQAPHTSRCHRRRRNKPCKVPCSL